MHDVLREPEPETAAERHARLAAELAVWARVAEQAPLLLVPPVVSRPTAKAV